MSIGTTQVDLHRNCIIVEIIDPCYDHFGDECQEKVIDQIADALDKLGSDIKILKRFALQDYVVQSHTRYATIIDQNEE